MIDVEIEQLTECISSNFLSFSLPVFTLIQYTPVYRQIRYEISNSCHNFSKKIQTVYPDSLFYIHYIARFHSDENDKRGEGKRTAGTSWILICERPWAAASTQQFFSCVHVCEVMPLALSLFKIDFGAVRPDSASRRRRRFLRQGCIYMRDRPIRSFRFTFKKSLGAHRHFNSNILERSSLRINYT